MKSVDLIPYLTPKRAKRRDKESYNFMDVPLSRERDQINETDQTDQQVVLEPTSHWSGRGTACLLRTAFFLTMNPQGVGKRLLQGKLQEPSQESNTDLKRSYSWVTWMPKETGDMPAIM